MRKNFKFVFGIHLHGLKLHKYLSLYAPITSDECHAWFHFHAASPAARNTEQLNITKKKSYPR